MCLLKEGLQPTRFLLHVFRSARLAVFVRVHLKRLWYSVRVVQCVLRALERGVDIVVACECIAL